MNSILCSLCSIALKTVLSFSSFLGLHTAVCPTYSALQLDTSFLLFLSSCSFQDYSSHWHVSAPSLSLVMILVATPITCSPHFQEPSNLPKLGDFYSENGSSVFLQKGMWCHSWLTHCATRRKVGGSIPDGDRILHQHNPSGYNMALDWSQSLKEMSNRNIIWGVRQGQIKLFGAHRQWKHFRPLFQAVFLLGGGTTPQTESNTTPPSPKTEITNILFYILNFASIIKFKM